jgi:DNA repair ATPase RecN
MVDLEQITVKRFTYAGTQAMNESNTLFSRIGSWIKGANGHGGSELKLQPDSHQQIVQRKKLFPWGRRDQAIENLQSGFMTLTDLMAAIKANLDRQDHRNEELLGALQQLPQILQSVPEASKLQSETLRAIHQQMENQNSQQTKLGEILDRICEADVTQTSTIDALRDRVESLTEHDQAIASNLNSVGSAMTTLSENTHASATVLQSLRDSGEQRDRELEKILHRQGTRFTTMLAVAIVLSIAALASVATMAYLGYELLNKAK